MPHFASSCNPHLGASILVWPWLSSYIEFSLRCTCVFLHEKVCTIGLLQTVHFHARVNITTRARTGPARKKAEVKAGPHVMKHTLTYSVTMHSKLVLIEI